MENPLNQQNGSRLSVVALILFIIAFLAAAFYIKPQWDEVSALQVESEQLREDRANISQKLTELQTLQQELNQSSEVSRETTLAAIPQTLDQDELIRELTALALENDMILNSMNFSIPQSESNGAEITRAQVNLNVTGSQSELISFLRALETSSRKILVKNITVQLGEQALGARVNFSVSAEVYYQGSI